MIKNGRLGIYDIGQGKELGIGKLIKFLFVFYVVLFYGLKFSSYNYFHNIAD